MFVSMISRLVTSPFLINNPLKTAALKVQISNNLFKGFFLVRMILIACLFEMLLKSKIYISYLYVTILY